MVIDCFQVQERFEVDIKGLPEQIDTSTYSMSCIPENVYSNFIYAKVNFENAYLNYSLI